MIAGIGLDIIEIDRIKKALKNERFVQRIFTDAEQAYCGSRGSQRFESYAARFAGKEAVFKAFGSAPSGAQWLDIEILPDAYGRPAVKLSGGFAQLANDRGITSIHISLTHARQVAAAQVVIEGGLAE